MESSLFDELSTGMKALVVFESLGISLTAIIGCIGNALTILVVPRTPTLKKGYNYFLVNLAIADLLINVLNDPFAAISISYRQWPLHENMCKFLGLITILSCTVSVGSLVAIAINRYIVIVRWNTSLSFVFTAKRSVIWCAVIWMLAILTIIPPLLGFGSFGFNKAMVACVLKHDREGRRYMLIFLVFYFIIASIIICFCYVRIYLYVYKCRQRLEGHTQNTETHWNTEIRVIQEPFSCVYNYRSLLGTSVNPDHSRQKFKCTIYTLAIGGFHGDP